MKNLLSKPNLNKWVEKLLKLPPVFRTGILTATGFLILMLAYLLIIEPLINLEENWNRELKEKGLKLAHYQSLVANKDKVADHLQSLQTKLAAANEQMLAGGNPAVAAADLQEILKNLLKTYGAQILAINVQPPKERGPYLEVPIMVQLSSNIDQLFNILYQLEHNQKFLVVLDINIIRSEDVQEKNANLQTDLIVAGMIKKGVAS